MSIRLRLTLLYTGLVVVVILAFGSTLYLGHSRQTWSQMEAGIATAAMRMAGPREMWHGDSNRGADWDVGREPSRYLMPQLPPMRPPVAYAMTRLADGTVVERTAGLGDKDLPLGESGLEAVLAGRTWSEVTVDTDNERLLVVSVPLHRSDTVVGVIQVAGSLAMVDTYLGGLRRNLVVITLAAVVVAFAGGWVLAGQVLRPIERITSTALAIGSERDFGRRVDHRGPDDELGRLVRTFNGMLAELEQAYVGLEESLQTQRRFVADASHELRTPLTTVRGNSELLLLDPPISAEDRAAAVRDIVDETDRLIGLTNELLTLARADAGRALARVPVPLAPLLEDLRRQILLLSPGRDVGFGPVPDVSVLGDRDALKQVLLNLIENALKHTPASADIAVTVTPGDTGVAVAVRDTGRGIAPEQLPRIFERFHRGDQKRTSPGTGLGLSIAHALTEAQGGSIAVQSRLGVGTTFVVTLPRATGADTGPADAGGPAVSARSQGPLGPSQGATGNL